MVLLKGHGLLNETVVDLGLFAFAVVFLVDFVHAFGPAVGVLGVGKDFVKRVRLSDLGQAGKRVGQQPKVFHCEKKIVMGLFCALRVFGDKN